MWRYLQTMGRALYPCSKPRSKPASATDPRIVVPLPLPSSPPDSTNLSVSAPAEPSNAKPDRTKDRHESHSPMVLSTLGQLFTSSIRSHYRPNNKITVVGASDLGVATVFSLLSKGVTNDISMIDCSEEKLKGELLDLQSGTKFFDNAKIQASRDYAITAGSKICVLTACSEIASGHKIYDCVRCNADVLKAAVPQLLHYSPNCVLVIAMDPVDELSYLAWRVSNLPKGRVVGTGTNLSCATFRYLLAERLGLAPSACTGYIIGENGKSSVPVWSGVSVGGVLLRDLNPNIGTDVDPENWKEIHHQVVQSCQEIKALKGYNSWSSALSITDICAAILNDKNCVRPLSTYAKGVHEIGEEVFVSLPCVVGAAGATDVIRQPLTYDEADLLRKSAEVVASNLGRHKIIQ